MSVPVASERKPFLPLRLRPTTGLVGPRPTIPMPTVTENHDKSSLTVGSRVLVNGLKSGTLRYIGVVEFAQGIFCGIELDQPDGKHDGEVKDVRYFQCPINHGVFVPHDKVVLAPRTRASSSQRTVSRLKPPTMTRSITITSSMNKFEPSKSFQLPDIVPNPTTSPVTLHEPIVNDNHELMTMPAEQPEEETMTNLEFQPIPIDEPLESIEVDFTDSVSLILHQLQQEQLQSEPHSSSITISEEETDDETDELDNESVVGSTTNEQIDKTRQSSVSSVFIPMELSKSIQTDLSFHSKDNISFTKVPLSENQSKIIKKDERMNINKKKSPVQPVKKNIERRPVTSPTTMTKRPITNIVPRKPSIIPTRKAPTPRTKLNSAQSISSLTSPSKLSLSLSSSNSLNSSQSDVTSINKSSAIKQQPSDTNENVSPSADHSLISIEKQLEESQHNLHQLEQQLLIQKQISQSLQINSKHCKKSYQDLLNKFDLMHILSQYYINENEHTKQQHELQLSKARIIDDQLKTSIERLHTSHKNELITLGKQHQLGIEALNKTHEQQLNGYQQKIKHLSHENNEVDARCSVLQEKVDGFLTAMTNSEHADVLLCHVETLEKDRTSLQTVLDIKNKEITQLRTKLHDYEIQLGDQKALRKRMDMAENRTQDLECLLRQKQLSEKAAVVERDQLKEQVTQLERDNDQLKFENETLRYRIRERSFSVSMLSDKPAKLADEFIPLSSHEGQVRHRAYSISSTVLNAHENEHITRSLSSLNCILLHR